MDIRHRNGPGRGIGILRSKAEKLFDFNSRMGLGNASRLRAPAAVTYRRTRSALSELDLKRMILACTYGTGPMLTMKKGERVRWYLVALGGQFSVHTPHWHGNVVLHDGNPNARVSSL
jgi:hypothetical protein